MTKKKYTSLLAGRETLDFLPRGEGEAGLSSACADAPAPAPGLETVTATATATEEIGIETAAGTAIVAATEIEIGTAEAAEVASMTCSGTTRERAAEKRGGGPTTAPRG